MQTKKHMRTLTHRIAKDNISSANSLFFSLNFLLVQLWSHKRTDFWVLTTTLALRLLQVFGYKASRHLGNGFRQLHRDDDTLTALLVHLLCAFCSYILVNAAAAMTLHRVAMVPSLLLTTPLSMVIAEFLCKGEKFDLGYVGPSGGWWNGFDLCNPFDDGLSLSVALTTMACLLYVAEIIYALVFVWPVNVRTYKRAWKSSSLNFCQPSYNSYNIVLNWSLTV